MYYWYLYETDRQIFDTNDLLTVHYRFFFQLLHLNKLLKTNFNGWRSCWSINTSIIVFYCCGEATCEHVDNKFMFLDSGACCQIVTYNKCGSFFGWIVICRSQKVEENLIFLFWILGYEYADIIRSHTKLTI